MRDMDTLNLGGIDSDDDNDKDADIDQQFKMARRMDIHYVANPDAVITIFIIFNKLF